MSILKKNDSTTTEQVNQTAKAINPVTEELAKLLEATDDFAKRLRIADRQVKRLGDRLSDLEEDGCETRALKRAKTDLADLDIAAIKSTASKLEDDLNAAELDPATKATESSLRALNRRSTKLQDEIEDAESTLKDIEATVKAAEDKIDQSQSDSDSSAIVVPETDGQKLDARMWALAMLPNYRAAGCPNLKTPEGKNIVFALPVPRPSGTKYIHLDPKTTKAEDLPDLMAGYFDKGKFVPLSGETGSRAEALMTLAYSGKLW